VETGTQRKQGVYKTETTTIENEIEKKRKMELEQIMSDMESDRFNSILNV